MLLKKRDMKHLTFLAALYFAPQPAFAGAVDGGGDWEWGFFAECNESLWEADNSLRLGIDDKNPEVGASLRAYTRSDGPWQASTDSLPAKKNIGFLSSVFFAYQTETLRVTIYPEPDPILVHKISLSKDGDREESQKKYYVARLDGHIPDDDPDDDKVFKNHKLYCWIY